MLQIPAANDERLESLERIVNENRTLVEARFRALEHEFLGSRSTLLALERSFAAWTPIRAEVIRLRHAGRTEEAVQMTEETGASQVARIERDMDAVSAFSAGKAAEFIEDMKKTRNRMRVVTWLLLSGSILAAAAIGWLTARSIRRPVVALSRAANRVAEGDYTQHVNFETNSELGTQARVFNMMVKAIREQTETIQHKNAENERLLLNILPAPIAGRLKNGERTIADAYGEVTVLFADIVGFTQFSSTMPVEELVEMLNELFSRFDAAAAREGVEKIKTIGDAYMAVSGMPSRCSDHTEKIMRLATDMLDAIVKFNQHRGTQLNLRIGVNRGPVVAGVIGTHKFIYDLWGDTVNIASRMESTGLPGRIQVTEATYEYLKDRCQFEARGEVAVKGKGMMPVFLLKQGPVLDTVACRFSGQVPEAFVSG
jgi:class 3 adenylate cyclase